MSLQDAKNGKVILSHDGDDYGFFQDSAEDSTHTKIMVSDSSDDGYRTGELPTGSDARGAPPLTIYIQLQRPSTKYSISSK
jgi:hypothetical protein